MFLLVSCGAVVCVTIAIIQSFNQPVTVDRPSKMINGPRVIFMHPLAAYLWHLERDLISFSVSASSVSSSRLNVAGSGEGQAAFDRSELYFARAMGTWPASRHRHPSRRDLQPAC